MTDVALIGVFSPTVGYTMVVDGATGLALHFDLTRWYDADAARPMTPAEIRGINDVLAGLESPLEIDAGGRLNRRRGARPSTVITSTPLWVLTIDRRTAAVVHYPSRRPLSATEIDAFNGLQSLQGRFQITTEAKIRVISRDDERRDSELGICTAPEQPFSCVHDSTGSAVNYVATPYAQIDQILASLRLDDRDVFVDCGCGKGRVLCVVARERIAKVCGIEIDAALVEQARRNVAALKGRRSEVELGCGDMCSADLPAGTVYYLAGDFSEQAMEAFLGRLEQSLRNSPRVVRLLLKSPRQDGTAACRRREWLALDRQSPWCEFRSDAMAGSRSPAGEDGAGLPGCTAVAAETPPTQTASPCEHP